VQGGSTALHLIQQQERGICVTFSQLYRQYTMVFLTYAKKRILHITWLIAITLILGGCRSQPLPVAVSEDPPPTTPLVPRSVVRFVADVSEQQELRPLIEVFEQENPQIDVQFVTLQEDPDVADDIDYVRWLAETGDVFASSSPRGFPPTYLLDLTPFVEQDATFQADDFYPHLLDNGSGGITVIPTHVSYQIIYFNRELFDAGRHSIPTKWMDS
jgi:ABC-type glycerol-3-phosphate transport system substrate-binding protein